MTVSLPPLSYAKPEQRTAFYDQVRSGVLALPGVEGVGMSTHIALKGSTGLNVVTVEGRPPADPRTIILDTEQQYVTDGYFRFMEIPFQRGREFEWADRGPAPPVAVVNAALVRKYFPHEDPLGRRIRFPGPEDTNPWLTIVGVSGDEKQSTTVSRNGVDAIRPLCIVPWLNKLRRLLTSSCVSHPCRSSAARRSSGKF